MQRLTAIVFALLFLALAPSSLCAQDKLGIFAGFSYVRPPVSVVQQAVFCPVEGQCSVPGTFARETAGLMGWDGSAIYNFTRRFALVADATGDYGKATTGFPRNARARQYAFLAGPQYSFRSTRLSPYIHVLAGATEQSIGSSGNSFFVTFPQMNWGVATAVGGGFDLKMSTNFSFRLLQADYLLTRLGGNFQSQPRVSVGFLIRF